MILLLSGCEPDEPGTLAVQVAMIPLDDRAA